MLDNGGDQARARNTDPWTSHAAAESLEPDKLRLSQEAVLRFLRRHGPMDDGKLVKTYNGDVPQSPSGLRTRRAELVAKGLVVDSGDVVVMPSGRKAIIWRVSAASASLRR